MERKVVYFVPKHTEKHRSFNPSNLKIGREQTSKVPDTIHVPYNRFEAKYGKCDRVRVIDQDYVDKLHDLDVQEQTAIEAFRKLRKELLDEAYYRARPISIDEARQPRTPSGMKIEA